MSAQLLIFRNWLLASALALITACSGIGLPDFDEPEVELVGIEPLQANGMEARFLVKLRVINPNSIPLSIDGMSYDVSIRGYELSRPYCLQRGGVERKQRDGGYGPSGFCQHPVRREPVAHAPGQRNQYDCGYHVRAAEQQRTDRGGMVSVLTDAVMSDA